MVQSAPLIIQEVPEQLHYSKNETDGWREKGEKMTVTTQQTVLDNVPQPEVAVLNLAIWR